MGKTPKKPNPKSFINRIKQNILDASPNATFNDKDKIQRWVKFYEQMSRPDINRVVMGGTAFFLQPAIDASNKKVDDDTRKVSICRTIAKIITGTSVGIIVRGSAYKAVEKMFPGTKVQSVNTMNMDGKTKRRGLTFGKTAKTKKAIVQLTAESAEIEIFQGL